MIRRGHLKRLRRKPARFSRMRFDLQTTGMSSMLVFVLWHFGHSTQQLPKLLSPPIVAGFW